MKNLTLIELIYHFPASTSLLYQINLSKQDTLKYVCTKKRNCFERTASDILFFILPFLKPDKIFETFQTLYYESNAILRYLKEERQD